MDQYGKIVSVVVAAVQELYKEILGIDREVASVKTEMQLKFQKLESENAQLKSRADKAEKENAAIKSYLCSKDPSAVICK